MRNTAAKFMNNLSRLQNNRGAIVYCSWGKCPLEVRKWPFETWRARTEPSTSLVINSSRRQDNGLVGNHRKMYLDCILSDNTLRKQFWLTGELTGSLTEVVKPWKHFQSCIKIKRPLQNFSRCFQFICWHYAFNAKEAKQGHLLGFFSPQYISC